MQYLKEEVKLEIMKAALEEFYLKGFEKASMKNIASNAGVAIGNIYRYFKNKEQLFNEIMEPVHREITALVFDQFIPNSESLKIQFDPVAIVDSIMKIYLTHGTELMIMVYKSEGTNYRNTKNDLVNLTYNRIQIEYMDTFLKTEVKNTETFMYVFAVTLTEGIFTILGRDETIEEKNKLINQLLIFYFNRLDERFI